MRKVRDYIHLFEGLAVDDEDLGSTRRGVCRVRIYQQLEDLVGEDGPQCPAPVALISELPDNPNAEVTKLIEVLAAELCVAHALPTHTTTFIEHYERTEDEVARGIPETYSQVEFSGRGLDFVAVEGEIRISFGEPSFSHLTQEEVSQTMAWHNIGRIRPHSCRFAR